MLIAVLKLDAHTCYGTDFQLTYPVTAISSRMIMDACDTGARFKVSVLPGQTMNVTALDFNPRSVADPPLRERRGFHPYFFSV